MPVSFLFIPRKIFSLRIKSFFLFAVIINTVMVMSWHNKFMNLVLIAGTVIKETGTIIFSLS